MHKIKQLSRAQTAQLDGSHADLLLGHSPHAHAHFSSAFNK